MAKLRSPYKLNFSPKLAAFPYQNDAVEAIRDLEYAAVFHEQGLGKTKIAMDVALYWLNHDVVDMVLIVTKKSLIRNWKREMLTHSNFSPAIFSQSRRQNYFVFNSISRFLVANFETIHSEEARFKLLLKSRNVGVIVDESAKIKNPKAEVTKSLQRLSPLFKRRIIMTGTPVANRPYDLWSQVWFLDHGKSLGDDYDAFRKDTDLSNKLSESAEKQNEFENNLVQIFDKIKSFSVRETKDSGIIQLPEKIIETVLADWENTQYDLYRQYRDSLRAIIVREGIPTEDNAESVLKRLLRLVQIASNPGLVDQAYRADPGKLEPLVDLVDRIRDKGEKCIVWTSFNENVDWLTQIFKKYGAVRVSGHLPIDQRNRAIDKFLADEKVGVLVATPGAAKEGLTLTVANHVIFYDRTFSLDDYLQAQDRIHRISQVKTCYVHNLVLPDSIDEWVDVLLKAKQLAAQLAQGDISVDQYRLKMSYDFGQILKGILGMEETPNG